MKNLVCLSVVALACLFSSNVYGQGGNDPCAAADQAIEQAQELKSDSEQARADALHAKNYAAQQKADAQAAWDAVKDHECVTPELVDEINEHFDAYTQAITLGNTWYGGSTSAHGSGVIALADALIARGIDCPTAKIYADGAIAYFNLSIERADTANMYYGDAVNEMFQVLDTLDQFDWDCEPEEGEGGEGGDDPYPEPTPDPYPEEEPYGV